jgi:hypothetical protein
MQIVLVSVDLTASTTGGRVHRFASSAFDVVHNGYEFRAVGDLMAIEELEESNDLTNLGIGITLSGIDPSYRTEIDNNGFKKAPIVILVAELDDTANTNIIPTEKAFIYHRGTCDTPNTTVDYDSGTMSIEISTESVFGSLVKLPDLCRTSQASHESRHAGDKFFTFVASIAQEETWRS